MPAADITLYAQWGPAFAGGTGAPGDPYRIATAEHLYNVRNQPMAAYEQITDIDLGVPPWNTGNGWLPIGTSAGPKFGGIYDGGYHTIDGMLIQRVGIGQGLFGYTESAYVANLRLRNVSMNVGNNNAGAIAGANQTLGSTFERVSASGTIVSTGYNVGGLIGFAQNLTMKESYAQVQVTAAYNAGGLVGNLSGGTIENSYATGDVTGNLMDGRVGGLLGNKSGTVTNSYSAGHVASGGGPIGGLIGDGGGPVNSSYYDEDTSGQSDDLGRGAPRTTAQMTEQATFIGWDFALTWVLLPGISYPYLNWQGGADVPFP